MREDLWLDFLYMVQPNSYVDDASAYTWGPDPKAVIDNVKIIVAIQLCSWEI